HANSSDAALRITYGLVLVLTVAVLGPYAFVQANEDTLRVAASWLRCLSPIPAVMEVLGHGDIGSQGLGVGFSATARYLLLPSITSIVLICATIRRLNHRLLDRARAPGVMTEERSTTAKVTRRLLFVVDPQRRSGYIRRWVNPVMVKEFRCRRFGRSHW